MSPWTYFFMFCDAVKITYTANLLKSIVGLTNVGFT